MDIRINGRTVNSSRPVYIGVDADNNVLDLVFTGLPEIGGSQLVTLNWLTDGDEPVGDIEAMSKTEAGYAYTVTSGLTQFAGRTVRAYIEVKSGDKSWHTDPFLLDATALPEVEATLEPTDPTIIQQVKDALEQANAAATRAEEAAKRAEEAGGGIDEEQLQEAVESALEEAKESGEFDGKDGISPTVTVEDITGGHRVSITDANGQKVFDVEDGKDGQPGQSGVHVGPDEPTDTDVKVWVDPDGEPDPFPVASADTLGGVKVGNGLVMDGEVLGVKPEENFEKIEEITVNDETVRRIDRSIEPNGNPYNFKVIYLLCLTPKADASGTLYIRANGINIAPCTNTIASDTDKGGIGQFFAEVKNGMTIGWGVGGRNLQTASQLYKYITEKGVPRDEKSITNITILSTVDMPIGTTITIWGVRA